jgi:hypothetical protein
VFLIQGVTYSNLVRRQAIVIPIFRAFLQFLQANPGVVHLFSLRSPPSTSFSIHYVSIIPKFDGVYSEVFIVSVNELLVNKYLQLFPASHTEKEGFVKRNFGAMFPP